MSTTTLASDDFNFSTLDPRSIERAFRAHVKRFEAQNRDVSWETAPAVFAAVSGGAEDPFCATTESLFRGAMEDLLDSGAIRVKRLADSGNRLVTAS